jgi:hypothetical protein
LLDYSKHATWSQKKEYHEGFLQAKMKIYRSQKKEYHEGRIGGLAKGGSSLRDVEGFAWRFRLRSSCMHVGAAAQVTFRVLHLRVKNQGLAFTGYAWQ